MSSTKWNTLLALIVFAGVLLACKYSATTANISALKIGKDKGVTSETSSFGQHDTIYALSTISNVPGKVKVKGRLVVDNVEGQKAGPIPGLEDTVELPRPKGKYKLEVLLLTEDGEQKDEESTGFTVS
jgi:hypothetical protein